MQINLNYVHNSRMGYGRLGVNLAEALARRAVEVFDHLPHPPGTRGESAPDGRSSGLAGSVCWVSTPPQAFGWWSTQAPSIFTMWEATRLPESFRENLHHFETVLVPSHQNVELFSEWHDDVRLCLLGIDPAKWHYVERSVPTVFFDFLIGGSGTRKGTDVAFAAFKAAFPTASPDRPIPRLIMKNPRNEHFRFDDRVEVRAGKMSGPEERALYATAHCYLQPSRGEGFGLQPLQAIAQGIPTILTDAHGHDSFAHLGYGIGHTWAKSDYFMYGDAGQWWEPNLDDLIDRMRWVYDHYDEACAHAKVGAAVVAQDFTWDRCAETFLSHVDCTRPYIEGGTWNVPERRKYLLRVSEPRRVDIAGRLLTFEPGVDYFELADVKRVLFEAGYLDPACVITEDSGLADEQLARMAGDNDLTRWHAGV